MIESDRLQFDKNDADTLVGVIARSAGVWDSKCLVPVPVPVPVVAIGLVLVLAGPPHVQWFRPVASWRGRVANASARQTTRRCARARARRCGRSARSSATAACCEAGRHADRASNHRAGLEPRSDAIEITRAP